MKAAGGRKALVTTCTWIPRSSKSGNHGFQLAIADQRIATDERQMQAADAVDATPERRR